MKNIDTLIPDIYDVIEGKGGWDQTITEHLAGRIADTLGENFDRPKRRVVKLWMSNFGKQCQRQLWYSINQPENEEPLPSSVKLNFTFGHILEDLLISLAKAAGHTVEAEQEVVTVNGVGGRLDCIIDGCVVDVKSASNSAFFKFERNELKTKDPFGYIAQLSGYLSGLQEDDRVTDKDHGYFWVINKNNGKMLLDKYDLRKEVANKDKEIDEARAMIGRPQPPERGYQPKPNGKSGNKELDFECSHCPFKFTCYPNLRVFRGYKGPVYMTTVKREPKMDEITDEYKL